MTPSSGGEPARATQGVPGTLVGFTGDVFLGGGGDCARPFARLRDQFPGRARIVLNFEGTVHDPETRLSPERQKILLTSPATLLDALDDLPVLLACVGNNHVNDYGNDVAELTVELLSQRFPTFGAGYEKDDFHLLVHDIDGRSVGIASYCTEDTSPIFCGADRMGPRPLTGESAARDLARLREQSSACVAIVHWGEEYFHYPNLRQVHLGRMLVECGYDLVIGSHSHSVQGYERYHGRLIFYSLGNFHFPDYSPVIDDRQYRIKWMRRCCWGIVPLFRVSTAGFELAEIRFVKRSHEGMPVLVDAPALQARLDRLSRAVASTGYSFGYERRRRREELIIRIEEFMGNDRKLTTLGRKLSTILGFKSRGSRSEGGS